MSDDIWDRLIAGAENDAGDRRVAMPTHRPSVAVLACSDARVPPSLVFDQPADELFVVRIAGNTASPVAIASLEYAVDHLGVELIVVLGHTHCGAVTAAAAGLCAGTLGPVVKPICHLAHECPDATPAQLETLNVQRTVDDVTRAGGTISDFVRRGRLDVKGAIFDLDEATVRLVDVAPSTTP